MLNWQRLGKPTVQRQALWWCGHKPKVGQDFLKLVEVIMGRRLSMGGVRAGTGGDDPDRAA